MSGVGGFCACKALSSATTIRPPPRGPFDRDRDGFVLGEGAGILILEEFEHAKKRGARIYAELAGMGMSADANHITAPNMDGPRRAMLAALRNAGATPRRPVRERARHLDAAGRRQRDRGAQGRVRRARLQARGELHQVDARPPAGAAGGVEAVITALAVHHQVSPPTINIITPDPACDLDYVPGTAREMKIEAALSNSFGFGGTNGTLAFRRFH
jgi:3-oxoacyl-[acyl-carrier-protein] synthase II